MRCLIIIPAIVAASAATAQPACPPPSESEMAVANETIATAVEPPLISGLAQKYQSQRFDRFFRSEVFMPKVEAARRWITGNVNGCNRALLLRALDEWAARARHTEEMEIKRERDRAAEEEKKKMMEAARSAIPRLPSQSGP